MSDQAAPLLHATLGPQDRAEYLRDLSALVEVESVLVDDGTGTRPCRLDEAFAALEAQTVRRAQLRYRYDARAWIDTLVLDGGDPGLVRLVRVAEDDVVSEA